MSSFQQQSQQRPSADDFKAPSKGMLFHAVLKCHDLKQSLAFYREVLGMHVIRHDEKDEPCKVTCNGDFDSTWSKTMVGYGPEDSSFVLELIHNHDLGNQKYDIGNALQSISIIDKGQRITEKLEKSGQELKPCCYDSRVRVVNDPDGRTWRLVPEHLNDQLKDREERFLMVSLRGMDPTKCAQWYRQRFGLCESKLGMNANEGGCVIGYAPEQCQLEFCPVEDEGGCPDHGNAVFRLALGALDGNDDESDVERIQEFLQKDCDNCVKHEMTKLPGDDKLFLAVFRDCCGFELVWVNGHAFQRSVHKAETKAKQKVGRGEELVDWEVYERKIREGRCCNKKSESMSSERMQQLDMGLKTHDQQQVKQKQLGDVKSSKGQGKQSGRTCDEGGMCGDKKDTKTQQSQGVSQAGKRTTSASSSSQSSSSSSSSSSGSSSSTSSSNTPFESSFAQSGADQQQTISRMVDHDIEAIKLEDFLEGVDDKQTPAEKQHAAQQKADSKQQKEQRQLPQQVQTGSVQRRSIDEQNAGPQQQQKEQLQHEQQGQREQKKQQQAPQLTSAQLQAQPKMHRGLKPHLDDWAGTAVGDRPATKNLPKPKDVMQLHQFLDDKEKSDLSLPHQQVLSSRLVKPSEMDQSQKSGDSSGAQQQQKEHGQPKNQSETHSSEVQLRDVEEESRPPVGLQVGTHQPQMKAHEMPPRNGDQQQDDTEEVDDDEQEKVTGGIAKYKGKGLAKVQSGSSESSHGGGGGDRMDKGSSVDVSHGEKDAEELANKVESVQLDKKQSPQDTQTQQQKKDVGQPQKTKQDTSGTASKLAGATIEEITRGRHRAVMEQIRGRKPQFLLPDQPSATPGRIKVLHTTGGSAGVAASKPRTQHQQHEEQQKQASASAQPVDKGKDDDDEFGADDQDEDDEEPFVNPPRYLKRRMSTSGHSDSLAKFDGPLLEVHSLNLWNLMLKEREIVIAAFLDRGDQSRYLRNQFRKLGEAHSVKGVRFAVVDTSDLLEKCGSQASKECCAPAILQQHGLLEHYLPLVAFLRHGRLVDQVVLRQRIGTDEDGQPKYAMHPASTLVDRESLQTLISKVAVMTHGRT